MPIRDIGPKQRSKRYSLEYRETLSPALPRTYRSPKPVVKASGLEQFIRYFATLLALLLFFRFLISLFSPKHLGFFPNTLSILTNWIVQPFIGLVHSTRLASALALVFVIIVASLIIIALNRKTVD